MNSASCPTCGFVRTRDLGPSSFADWAESPLVARLRANSGNLYRCPQCHLVFRHPVPSPEELISAYDSIPGSAWSYTQPPWWHWVREAIERYSSNPKVLDVGCFRGDFLSTLPERFERYGIEPNSEAAATAESREIRIISSDIGQPLSGFDNHFGAIVLMDVAEHLPNPAATFEMLQSYLAPGGILIVLTGNSDHWLARASLPYYWYMSFPIHLVYLGDRHFAWIQRQQQWSALDKIHFAHEVQGAGRSFRQGFTGIRSALWHKWLHRRAPFLKKTIFFRRIAQQVAPPLLFSLQDHVGLVLRRK